MNKIKENTPKKPKNKTKISKNIPLCPEYFNGYARKKWEELAPIFVAKNMLNDDNLSAFELLCLHYGDAMILYDSMVNEYGSIAGYLTGRNSQTMGEYLAYNKAIQAYTKMLTEFGLTPASKKKVPSVEIVDEEDTLAKLINN